MKIAIIGVGNLGYSIALGILGEGQITFDSLYLSKRNTKTLIILINLKETYFINYIFEYISSLTTCGFSAQNISKFTSAGFTPIPHNNLLIVAT